MPATAVVARAALHYGEEPCLTGTRGSGAIFFAGCPLGCVFCQNEAISHRRFGREVSPARLAAIFRELEVQGAHNLNLVSPGHFTPAILEAFSLYRPALPVVVNTSGYETVDTLRLWEGVADVYLPDLKTLDPALARDALGAADYPARATAAIAEMARQVGPLRLDGDGLVQRGLMVRHLVLPGHTQASLAVLDWLTAHLPRGAYISLMMQYTPPARPLADPALNRRLTAREAAKVEEYLLGRDWPDGFIQDRASAGAQHVPAFDLTGVLAPPHRPAADRPPGCS